MLRHTAFFLHRDITTPEQHDVMLRGLAYLRSACAGPVAGDYGDDIFGGSHRLREIRPSKRTPFWRAAARREGPPADYDVALHLDFDDEAGMAAYNHDAIHHHIGEYNASINYGEFTARVDYWYERPPLTTRGLVRHTALFVWDDDATQAAKRAAQDAIRRLEREPGVHSVTIGQNVGTLTTDYDWIYDLQLDDRAATEALLKGEAFAEAMRAVAAATKYEWTARLSHVMRGS